MTSKGVTSSFEDKLPIFRDAIHDSDIVGMLIIRDESISQKFRAMLLDLHFEYYNDGRPNALISLSFQPFRFSKEGNCLDKQRVKETITRILSSPKKGRWSQINSLDFAVEAQKELKKELGLE